MTHPGQLRCYDYTSVPYERVREALASDAPGLFQRATATAAGRAQGLLARLHMDVAGIDVGTAIQIRVLEWAETTSPFGDPATTVTLKWTAARNAGLFPEMDATLSAYPLSATETQLELMGQYRPPLGSVGAAIDRLAGHRIAEAAVLRFVQEIAAQLNRELGARP